jgi:Lon protease-like protein
MKIPFAAFVSLVIHFGTNYGVSAFTSCPSVLRQSVVPFIYDSKGKIAVVSSRTFGVVSTRKRSNERSRLHAIDDDDDEDDGPLGKGIDSVSWLPTVYNAKNVQNPMIRKDSEILPLFPLGGIVYTPNSEHILNIFEPRYRQMYTDILMNGTKRFVVAMSHPQEKGRFAQMGVLFELQDLKEVSELTNDQIKYICNHKVTGRVKLHRILNPTDWESRSTYLKVEGTIIDDTKTEDEEPAVIRDVYTAFASAMGSVQESKAEKDLKASFADLVEIQHELEEDVRFTKVSVNVLSVKPGPGEDGLWQTIRLWQAYADQRLVARQNELQKDFQAKLQDFLKKEKGMKENELPSSISFQELSEELQKEVQKLQKRMAIDLEPLILESTLTMQKILEAENHEARCDLLRYFIDAERQRLNAKRILRGMFASTTTTNLPSDSSQSTESSSPSSSSSSSSPADGTSSASLPTFPSSSETPSIYDQPDAFQ